MPDIYPTPTRVRFDIRRRELRVDARELLTPHMLRLTLSGDLSEFQSLGFDDHVKLFFPDPATGEAVMRDYTPRRFDVAAGRLVIDFALHDEAGTQGPATAWAETAQVGDILHIGGPRGSQILPDVYGHYVLIGDETALPAIGRRLEELPAGTPVTVLALVDGPQDVQTLPTQTNADIRWLYRSEGENLLDAVTDLTLPTALTHVWAAGEAGEMRALKTHLTVERGIDPRQVKCAGYWRRGEAGAYEVMD